AACNKHSRRAPTGDSTSIGKNTMTGPRRINIGRGLMAAPLPRLQAGPWYTNIRPGGDGVPYQRRSNSPAADTERADVPGSALLVRGYRLGWSRVCAIFCWSHQEKHPR